MPKSFRLTERCGLSGSVQDATGLCVCCICVCCIHTGVYAWWIHGVLPFIDWLCACIRIYRYLLHLWFCTKLIRLNKRIKTRTWHKNRALRSAGQKHNFILIWRERVLISKVQRRHTQTNDYNYWSVTLVPFLQRKSHFDLLLLLVSTLFCNWCNVCNVSIKVNLITRKEKHTNLI